MMAHDEFRFVHTLRVRYDEIDGQQIVYNARYLAYSDFAQVEYFRTGIGLHLFDLAEADTFDVATVHAELDYIQSFRLDDLVEIGVRCTAIGNTSLQFTYEMWKQGENEARFKCNVVYVNFDPVRRTKRPVPTVVRDAIARFEGWERV
jgi:YbgC/YbaW family acyl-CoA thioester hydrolase